MTSLLTADWHLTDNYADEYRWEVFDTIVDLHDRLKFQTLYIMGDVCDRKDKHSAALVNRVIENLRRLLVKGIMVDVLLGNHDKPLSGIPYWAFLNNAFGENSGLRVLVDPEIRGKFVLLPFSAQPLKDWGGIHFFPGRVVLMHQPVSGADVGNGRTMQAPPLPEFPRGVTVYSGDIHIPQRIGNVTYIGAPHPIDFGDDYECRMLLIDDAGKLLKPITLQTIQKAVVKIRSAEDLNNYHFSAGDQIRILATIDVKRSSEWPLIEQAITEWAVRQRITVASTNVNVVLGEAEDAVSADEPEADPERVLTQYMAAEGIEGPIESMGHKLLKDTLK